MDDVWPMVHHERERLIADLSAVPAERWTTPSLCEGWDVHDVVAHLVDDALTTRLGFVRALVGARLDFDRLNARGAARHRRDDPSDTLAAFEGVTHRRTSAPAPLASRLVEVCVHGEDVRRPLGISHEYAVRAVTGALGHQLATKVAMGGAKERAAGLQLIATDLDWRYGAGAEVHGTGLALLLAVSGRRLAPGELTGEGAARLS